MISYCEKFISHNWMCVLVFNLPLLKVIVGIKSYFTSVFCMLERRIYYLFSCSLMCQGSPWYLIKRKKEVWIWLIMRRVFIQNSLNIFCKGYLRTFSQTAVTFLAERANSLYLENKIEKVCMTWQLIMRFPQF